MAVTSGDVVTLHIEKPTAGGRMLARHQGQVVLVFNAIPGERVRARVERGGPSVAYAETVDVLEPSPDRRANAADWRCGGSVFAHVDYQRQLTLKAEILEDAFARIARLPLSARPDVVASPEVGYRMRARLHAVDGRLGFYREGTHELCAAGPTRQLLPSTLEWIQRVEAHARGELASDLAGCEIAEDVSGDQRACHLELYARADARKWTAVAAGLRGLSAQSSDRAEATVLAGDPSVVDEVSVREEEPALAVQLRRGVRAFFQGNRFLLERLVRHVISLVPPGPVIDLYAGVGLFGLALAATRPDPVTLVESEPAAGRDLLANATPFLDRVRVLRINVESFLSARSRDAVSGWAPATCVVDPPRTGLSKEALAGLLARRPSHLVYVSCDVATLARDTRKLIDAGYALGPMTAFDLFPNTAHVETVVVLTRDGLDRLA